MHRRTVDQVADKLLDQPTSAERLTWAVQETKLESELARGKGWIQEVSACSQSQDR